MSINAVMSIDHPKAELVRYLRTAREALVWKTESLGEYDLRRPLTPTGTNLLGLVKHLAGVESEYFGLVFGRPFGEPLPWLDGDSDDDLWATADERSEDIIGLYRRAVVHADATIDALPLDATGSVPWWPAEHAEVTLHRVLVHMVAETNRHAGHADIVRELVDGSVGLRAGPTNLPPERPHRWRDHYARVEQAAIDAGSR